MFGNETKAIGTASIFSAREIEKWQKALEHFPVRDIYFTSDYHRLCEIDADREARAYFSTDNGESLFFPFLLGVIPGSEFKGGQLYDLETCYGYSGPLCTTNDQKVLKRLWEPFLHFCDESRIVAGFSRCHPILATQGYCAETTKIVFNRDTIYVNLDCTQEELWNSYPSNQRTRIRKATASGLSFRQAKSNEVESVFLPMYNANLDRMQASSRYYFSEQYFDFLANEFKDFIDLLVVEKDGLPIASAIFLLGDGVYHYHLGASLREYTQYRPNNLLFHEAGRLGISYGMKKMHLGGGRSVADDDSLFQFKSSFSQLRVPFYLGYSIFQNELYDSLCQDWLLKTGCKTPPSDLLYYRLPVTKGS